jgi:hypothetical protein
MWLRCCGETITGTASFSSTFTPHLKQHLLKQMVGGGKGKRADMCGSNYECKANDGCSDSDDCLVIPDGVNNLASKGWGTRIRSLMCRNWDA